MRTLGIFAAFLTAVLLFVSTGYAENATRGPVSLGALRRLRALDDIMKAPGAQGPFNTAVVTAAATWKLTPAVTKMSPGTFGIDVSHWETEDCTIAWQTMVSIGLRYVYVEVSHGADDPNQYPSIAANWNLLGTLHDTKTLFRGAYHFLMPNSDLGTDPTAQVQKFLSVIGAVGGKQPAELPPIVDIEPTKTLIKPGSVEYNNCPVSYRSVDGDDTYCDMWYTYILANKRQSIVNLAQNFASAVKIKTGQDVMVYSGIGAWEEVIGPNTSLGQPLLKGRSIWMSRYTANNSTQNGAPQKDATWGAADWNAAWKMPTMFGGAAYPPPPTYNVPDFWQFTTSGELSSNPFTCPGVSNPFAGKLDFNYIPVRAAQFQTVFGIH